MNADRQPQSAAIDNPRRGWRWLRGSLIAGLTLVGLGSASWLAYPHFIAWQRWQGVQAALQTDDLSQAEQLLEQIAEAWPRSSGVHFQLARVRRRQLDLRGARQSLEEAARLGHPQDAVDLEKVLCLVQQGDLGTAESTIQALLEARHPESPLLFEALVRGYLRLHALRSAEQWATRWLESDPCCWQARLLRAQARELAVQLEAARQDYALVLEARPNHAVATFKLGEMLRRLDRYAEALPHLEAAAAQRPGDFEPVLSLARCLRSLGRPQDAAIVLERWQSEQGQSPAPLCMMLGRLALDLQQPERASAWLRRAEAASPADEQTLTALATLSRELGQEQDAEKYEARARDARRKLKRIDALLGSLRDQPQNAGVRAEIGQLLLTMGHDEEAARWLLSALELDSAHSAAHVALAEYYEENGDPEAARNHRLAAAGKVRARLER